MYFFEVRDEYGIAMVATEDYTQAVHSALSRKANAVVQVVSNCGEFEDCKIVWQR